jgi:hypothetical protein
MSDSDLIPPLPSNELGEFKKETDWLRVLYITACIAFIIITFLMIPSFLTFVPIPKEQSQLRITGAGNDTSPTLTYINNTNVRITFSIYDGISQTIRYNILINNVSTGTYNATSGVTYNGDVTLPYQINNSITINAFDEAGNKGTSTVIAKMVDIRPPEIALAVQSLGPTSCKAHAHIEPIPCEVGYTFEIVSSPYSRIGGMVFNTTINSTTYDADYWSNDDIMRVYVELACYNVLGTNKTYSFNLTAIKPGNFTVVQTIPTNYSTLMKNKSWVKWC